jgi:hypothetical protein
MGSRFGTRQDGDGVGDGGGGGGGGGRPAREAAEEKQWRREEAEAGRWAAEQVTYSLTSLLLPLSPALTNGVNH